MSDSDERISGLYQQSRNRLQPSRALDQAIVRNAHRAISKRRRAPYPALALAATVVIGVGLAWLQIGVPPVVDNTGQPPPLPMQEPVETARQSSPEQSRPAPTAARRNEATADSFSAPRVLSAPAAISRSPSAAKRQSHADVDQVIESRQRGVLEGESGGQTAGPCGLSGLPADQDEWERQIETARQAGDLPMLRCLQDQRKADLGEPR